jgi:transcriptional regulator with XRE-family HTH domain
MTTTATPSPKPSRLQHRKFSGRRVRLARKANRMTLEDLAAVLGCTASYINVVECGYRTMVRRWPDLADALNVPLDWFFVAPDEDDDNLVPAP